MDVQSAANLNIPEGGVRNIHDKDKRLLWSAVGYNVRYDGDTTQQTYTGKNKMPVQSVDLADNRIKEFVIALPAGTYTYSFDLDSFEVGTNSNFSIYSQLYLSNGTLKDNNISGPIDNTTPLGRKSYTFTLDVDAIIDLNHLSNIRIPLTQYNNGARASISNIMIESGSPATAYEPYVGGSPAPNPDYPQDVNVVQGKQDILVSSKNLLSVSFAVSGGVPSDIPTNTFVLDRENQRYFRCDFPTLLPPGTYTISFDISNNNTASGVSFNIFNKSETSIGGAYNLSGNHYSGTFTVSESVKIIRWFIASNESNDKHATISNVQIEAGSTATTYEMYQGQQTFPVDLIGKNLFSGWTIGKKLNGSGVETTDQNGAVSGFIPVASDTNYIFSDLPDGLYTFIAAYNSQKQFLGRTGASGGSSSKGCKTLTSYFSYGTPAGTGDVAYLRVTAYQSGQYADPITVINSLQTQLEVGTTATPYVPYYNYELCKIGDYQDYIYKSGDDWYVRKDVGKIVLDGDENVYVSGTQTSGRNRFFVDGPDDMITNTDTNIKGFLYSDKFIELANSQSFAGTTQGMLVRANGDKQFVINYYGVTTGSQFKTWISTNNVTVYYALGTPTYTKITDSTLISQLDAIHDWLTRYDYYGMVTGNLPIIINRTGLT